jgi:hypothetical protein
MGTTPRYYKSTITIYSEFDPTKVELSTLAREAETGDAICTSFGTEEVAPDNMPQDAASFFEVAA